MIRHTFALAAIVLLSPAQAQITPPAPERGLHLEDFERIAIANNPTIPQAEANLRIAEGLARQAGLYPNPSAGYYGDEIRGGYLGGGQQGGYLSQTIVLGGKLGAARREASLRAKQAATTIEIQRLRIRNNVRSLFYHALAAQRLVEVRQNLARLAADAVTTTRQLANVGQADRPDILQAEVEQQEAGMAVLVATEQLDAAWRALAAVSGKPGMPLARLAGDLEAVPDLNYPDWLARTLHDSPEVTLARQDLQRAEASLAVARKAPIPDLQLTGIVVQNFEPLEVPSPRITGVQAGVQLGVELPLFNRNQGNIAAAREDIERARQDLARLQLRLQRDLAARFSDYNSARLIVRQYKTGMMPRAEQAYKMYRANYENMAGAYPQVLISQRTLFQLEAGYVQALDHAWQSALAIQAFGLTDGLAAPQPAPLTGASTAPAAPSALVMAP
jgi:cobalt-zinc-cadmium efflux system outer membrane protein